MANVKILKEPYQMFVGTNGEKTFGIQVESLRSLSESEKQGHQHSWNINECLSF